MWFRLFTSLILCLFLQQKTALANDPIQSICNVRSLLDKMINAHYEPINFPEEHPFNYDFTGEEKQYLRGMIKRQNEGDPHIKKLNEWGIFFSEDHPPRVPMTLIVQKRNQEIKKWISEGKIKKDEVLNLSLEAYVVPKEITLNRENVSQYPLRFLNTEREYIHQDFKAIPRTNHLYHDDVSTMSIQTWASRYAKNETPIQVVSMDHELGHITGYGPNEMKAIHNFYKKVDSHQLPLEQFWSYDSVTKKMSDRITISAIKPGHKKMGQLMVVDECGSLVNLSETSLVKKMMPELFDSKLKTFQTLDQHSNYMNRLAINSPKKFNERLNQLFNSREKILERRGGAMRDSYNSIRLGANFEAFFPWAEVARTGHYPTFSGEILPQAFRDTLFARLGTAKLVHSFLLEEPYKIASLAYELHISESLVRLNLQKLVTDQVALVEMAISQGTKLRVNSAQLIIDISKPKIDQNSMAYRYFNSFSQPGSFSHWSFLEP